MIKIFRKIRESFIESGSARKYIIYALGEIALVVIGILIALQINNWNEEVKSQIFERQILKELLQDIRSDTSNVHAQSRRYTRIVGQINFWLSSSAHQDSIGRQFEDLFAGINLNLNTTTFETLQGKGLHSLQSDELRRTISEYYNKCRWYLDMVKKETGYFEEIYEEPFIKEHIYISYDMNDSSNWVPKNWKYLFGSEDFAYFLGFKKRNLKYNIYFLNAINREAIEAMSSIQEYLDK